MVTCAFLFGDKRKWSLSANGRKIRNVRIPFLLSIQTFVCTLEVSVTTDFLFDLDLADVRAKVENMMIEELDAEKTWPMPKWPNLIYGQNLFLQSNFVYLRN